MAIREAVTNALIHANAVHIDLDVVFNESEVTVTVRDDGCGFDLKAARSRKGHFGITGMQERVELLGGEMSIVSDLTHGTVVSIVVPRRPRMAERKEIVHVG